MTRHALDYRRSLVAAGLHLAALEVRIDDALARRLRYSGRKRGDGHATCCGDRSVRCFDVMQRRSELHLWFARMYDKDFDPGGLTTNERQATGRMCSRVIAVNDGYAANVATTVITDTKISGFVSGTDIDINATDAAANPDLTVTAADIEYDTQNLWLAKLTPQIRGHGCTSEASLTFATQQSFTPPSQSMSRLLFFDVRRSDDGLWQGWTSDGSVTGAQSFVGKVHAYFLTAPYGTSFFLEHHPATFATAPCGF